MIKPALTTEQAKKFAEGFNAKVANFNSDKTDGGRSPYRANTWADIGYEYARGVHLKQQLAKVKPVMSTITAKEANSFWMAK